ncbi:MAG: DMT family transporter [Anaerolineales bacterium]|nr:DMT family transporter [Anaerolineales bacterium]
MTAKRAIRRFGIWAGLGASAIWGGMYVVSKVVLEVIPPFSLITMRLILGVLTLWIIVSLRGGLHFRRKQALQVIGVGWLGYGVSIGFQFVGTKLSTASNGALITSATPAFILLFAAWLLRERITLQRVIALGASSLGVLVVIDPRSAHLSPEMFWGNISLVAAAVTWALYSVLVRLVTRDLEALPVSLVAFLGGFLVSVPAGAWELSATGIGEITWGVVAGVLFLGIISTALAMYLWNVAFATLEASVASLTLFAQPVVGAGLGAIFLGERLTPLFLLGGALIGFGLWLATWERKPQIA